jgi:transcriptional regulator with XRE-family HTH domain
MSHLADTLAQLIEAKGSNALEISRRCGISSSQLYLWLRSEQISISEEQLNALAPVVSDDMGDHATLVRAHLLDHLYGPGSELIRIEIDHAGVLRDAPRGRSKGEKALDYLREERLKNRELNLLLIDLARLLGENLE